jgi:hypothetical protein
MREQKMKWIKSQADVGQGQPGVAKPAAAAGEAGAGADAGAAGAGADTGALGAGAAGAGAAAGGGQPIINKNGTRMNAQEVATIADIFKTAGKDGMKAEELAEKLKERGIDATATKINGKMALKFANGDTFIDTSANGVLDSDDHEWKEALATLKGQYGDQLPAPQGNKVNAIQNMAAGTQAADATGGLGSNQGANAAGALPKLGSLQLPNPAYTGPRALGDPNQDPAQLKNVFADLDRTLGKNGYKGLTSQELYDRGQLEQVLSQYGVTMPQVPQQNDGTNEFVDSIFRYALQISAMK